MTKRIFTPEQQKELSRNKNIKKWSDKSITYTLEFKKRAIHLYHDKHMSAQEIFQQAGLTPEHVGKGTAHQCLNRWRKQYREKGLDAFKEETRGKKSTGRPKKPNYDNETIEEKIQRLEAENLYLKEENDFLVKVRAKRNL